MIRLVVFDMAGTTIDEDNMVYKCVQKALTNHGFLVDLEDVLHIAAGKEKRQAIVDMCTFLTGHKPEDTLVDGIYVSFSSLLDEAYDIMQLRVFDDFLPLKNFLRRNQIIIVFNTGYKEDVARKILLKAGITEGKDIDLLVTADMVSNGRPAPDMILYALEKYQIKPAACLKIGDSVVDILEGKNAKIAYSIGITTGAQKEAELMTAGPDKVIHHLRELIPLIEDVNKSL